MSFDDTATFTLITLLSLLNGRWTFTIGAALAKWLCGLDSQTSCKCYFPKSIVSTLWGFPFHRLGVCQWLRYVSSILVHHGKSTFAHQSLCYYSNEEWIAFLYSGWFYFLYALRESAFWGNASLCKPCILLRHCWEGRMYFLLGLFSDDQWYSTFCFAINVPVTAIYELTLIMRPTSLEFNQPVTRLQSWELSSSVFRPYASEIFFSIFRFNVQWLPVDVIAFESWSWRGSFFGFRVIIVSLLNVAIQSSWRKRLADDFRMSPLWIWAIRWTWWLRDTFMHYHNCAIPFERTQLYAT